MGLPKINVYAQNGLLFDGSSNKIYSDKEELITQLPFEISKFHCPLSHNLKNKIPILNTSEKKLIIFDIDRPEKSLIERLRYDELTLYKQNMEEAVARGMICSSICPESNDFYQVVDNRRLFHVKLSPDMKTETFTEILIDPSY